MKKIELECKNCGAPMHVSEDKSEATCPYCKYKFLLTKEPDIEELSKREEQLSYARKKGETRAIEESVKVNKAKVVAVIIILLVIAGIGYFLSGYYALEYMENPFKCVEVKFTGVTGQGSVTFIDSGKCKEYPNLNYIATKDENLKEGETIKVIVQSSKYRFDNSSKEYTVTGLSKYLTNLDSLTDEIITKLHESSYNHLKEKVFNSSFKGELVSLKPYKFYLYTNGTNKNILYDVYKAQTKTETGKIYEKIVVAYYKTFILLNNKELFSYSRLYHEGNLIKAGDPNAISIMDKNYAGNIVGFESIEDFKNYINKENSGEFEIFEK